MQSPGATVPNLFGTRDRFRGRQFFHGLGWGDGLGMIQAHFIQAHLLLCDPVPNRPGLVLVYGLVLVCGPEAGDPWPREAEGPRELRVQTENQSCLTGTEGHERARLEGTKGFLQLEEGDGRQEVFSLKKHTASKTSFP